MTLPVHQIGLHQMEAGQRLKADMRADHQVLGGDLARRPRSEVDAQLLQPPVDAPVAGSAAFDCR